MHLFIHLIRALFCFVIVLFCHESVYYLRFFKRFVVLKRTVVLFVGFCCCEQKPEVERRKAAGVVYLELVYLVTALVPSETACLANSPGSRRRTAVWISLLVIVERLL